MKVKVEVDLIEAIKDLGNGLYDWSEPTDGMLVQHLKETKELRRLLDILDKTIIQRNQVYQKTHKVTV